MITWETLSLYTSGRIDWSHQGETKCRVLSLWIILVLVLNVFHFLNSHCTSFCFTCSLNSPDGWTASCWNTVDRFFLASVLSEAKIWTHPKLICRGCVVMISVLLFVGQFGYQKNEPLSNSHLSDNNSLVLLWNAKYLRQTRM